MEAEKERAKGDILHAIPVGLFLPVAPWEAPVRLPEMD
jgi:hypothetical protein